jgi:hypothetical protein
VAEGHLPPDIDADGLHAALASMVFGYVVMRDHLADELDVDVHALDEQLATTVDRLVRQLASEVPTDGLRG